MILIVCVDDNMGMLFNERRQSQDSALRSRIIEITANSKLWMNHYSMEQFEKDIQPNMNFDDNFLNEAVEGEYCFVENEDVTKYEPYIDKVIVYKWNRRYPSDLQFDIDLSKWQMISSFEFAGSSHERITEEVYVK